MQYVIFGRSYPPLSFVIGKWKWKSNAVGPLYTVRLTEPAPRKICELYMGRDSTSVPALGENLFPLFWATLSFSVRSSSSHILVTSNAIDWLFLESSVLTCLIKLFTVEEPAPCDSEHNNFAVHRKTVIRSSEYSLILVQFCTDPGLPGPDNR